MKKFTLFLVSALVAVTGFAQTKGAHGETIDANGIITAPPADAELRSYDREGYYVIYGIDDEGYGSLFPYEANGQIDIAVCADGTYFIKDIVSQVKSGAWVIGTRTGNELRVPAGQKLFFDPSDGTFLKTFRCLFTATGDVEDNYDDFIFEVSPLTNGGEALAFQSYPDPSYLYNFLGAVWTDSNASIEAIGDYAVTFTYDPSNVGSEYETAVVLPEDIELKSYILHAYSYAYSAENNYKDTYIDADIQIGYKGDDMYIVGFYYFTPEFVIKGKRNGNIITFPQHQFLGRDGRQVDIYAISVKYGVDEDGDETFVDGENWTLEYDPSADCYYGDEDGAVRFARNRYYRYGNQYDTIDEILIYPAPNSSIESISNKPAAEAKAFDLQGRRVSELKGLVVKGGKVILSK